MKKIIAIILAALVLLPSVTFARGGSVSSGGRSSFSSSSSRSYSSYSSSRSSYSAPSSSRSTSSSSTARSATSGTLSRSTGSTSLRSLFGGSSTAKATTSPLSSTKTTTTSTGQKGYVVDSNYQPRFSGGYTAPAGSVVVYRQSSIMDWLPFYLIMNSNNAHRQATVTQPDGQTKEVKEEGVDGMYIMNWIITILFIGGVIGGIVYLVNKYTYKEEYE